MTLEKGSSRETPRTALVCEALVSDTEDTPTGVVRVLIDSGASRSFISQIWAKQHLQDTQGVPHKVEAVDGHEIQSYGSREILLRLADSTGTRTRLKWQCESVDMSRYDMILGYDWLQTVNPDIDWAQCRWSYKDETPSELEVVAAEEFEEGLQQPNSMYGELRFVPQDTDTATAGRAEEGRILTLGAVTESPDLAIPPDYEEYANVFDAEKASILAEHSQYDHAIDLIPGGVVPFKPLYPLSITESEVLKDYITDSLAKGWIQYSKSEGGAPVLFTPKKNGKLRLCVDYRGLNAITVKNRHALPLISESLARLAGARIYTKLDLRDAYHRIRIRKGDEWKTAFRTRYGHFEYRVMPFGLANAPATFQSYVNKALVGLIDVCLVVYLDDILIFSQDAEGHVRDVRTVLQRLREWNLYAGLEKCTFHTTQVEFLGFIVSNKGVAMDDTRVATIRDWPEPECIFDIQQFLGFANFYRRFIESYSKITRPLTDLVQGPDAQQKGRNKRKQDFELTESAREAFKEVKARFLRAPMLAHFDPSLQSMIESDASGYAYGGICSQKQGSGAWKPIAFYSKKMTPAQMNYEVGDQEMLAIVECFKEWRHYLEGSAHQIVVKTDHANLVKFMSTKELSRRQVRWAEYLARYDFVIVFRAGSQNPADAPSRRPDYERENAEDAHGEDRLGDLMARLEQCALRGRETQDLPAGTFTLNALFEGRTETKGHTAMISRQAATTGAAGESSMTQTLPIPLAELIHLAQTQDAESVKKRQELERGDQATGDSWSISPEDNLLRKSGKVYIPNEPALIAEIMRAHHDDPAAGHHAARRTSESIRSRFWWTNMRETIAEYVSECRICQKAAVKRHRPYGLLEPLPVPQKPMEWMSIDFITGLPPSRWDGRVYDSIMVAVDLFTKYSLYVPCTKDIDAEGLAEKFYDRIIPYFGMPENIVSDRGSVFTSEFWSRFCYLLGARRRLSTAFHPQTDGQTERQNQTLEYYLRSYVNWEQDDWARWLPLAQMVYNNSTHSAHATTPAYALMGIRPDLRLSVQTQEQEQEAGDVATRVNEMVVMREQLRTRLQRAKEIMKRNADKKRMDKNFRVSDWVLLRNKNIAQKRPARKIDYRYVGPFQIAEKVGQQAYRLILTPQYRTIHPTVHVSLLEPYHGNPHEANQRPGPIQVGDADEWLVERILQESKDKKHYYVKWAGYGDEENTWEPLAHVEETVAFDEFMSKRARKQAENADKTAQRPTRTRRKR